MTNQRVKAKELRKSGNHPEAVAQYKELWENKGIEWDKWLGWEYADSLKKIGQIDDAICVCRTIYEKEKTFKYNNDLLCWCLFEKHIKNFESILLSDLQKFIKVSNFIISNTVQDGKNTAYESTVFKVLKILQQQNNVRSAKLLKWLDRLDYKLLSEEVIEYQLENGRTQESASRKEQFFQIKSKALQKEMQHFECIKCCNLAFDEIKKFHFDNQIWLEVRRQYSICMSNDDKETALTAAKLIVELATRKNHWSIYSKAFECYEKIKEYEEAIINASKALLSNDPLDKKVSLLYQVGSLLELLNEPVKAKRYFLLVYKIREEHCWQISQSLIDKFDTDQIKNEYSIEQLIRELKTEWTNNIKLNQESFIGVVSNIVMPRRKSGFIKLGEHSYFFNISSIISGYSKLKEGSKVSFNLIDAFHPVSKAKVQNAVNIEVL